MILANVSKEELVEKSLGSLPMAGSVAWNYCEPGNHPLVF